MNNHWQVGPSVARTARLIKPGKYRRRGGFGLIETVGVVALIGMLLSLAAATLNRAYRIHHNTLNAFRELEQLNFWIDRFRTDAHQAIACELDGASLSGVSSQPADQIQALKFTHDDRSTVQYSLSSGQLFRVVERADKTLTREVLPAPPLTEVAWTLDERGRLPVVSCQLVFADAKSDMQPVEWWSRLLSLETNRSKAGNDGR